MKRIAYVFCLLNLSCLCGMERCVGQRPANQCPICLENFLPQNDPNGVIVPGNYVFGRRSNSCSGTHRFHANCLCSWLDTLNQDARCPICRALQRHQAVEGTPIAIIGAMEVPVDDEADAPSPLEMSSLLLRAAAAGDLDTMRRVVGSCAPVDIHEALQTAIEHQRRGVMSYLARILPDDMDSLYEKLQIFCEIGEFDAAHSLIRCGFITKRGAIDPLLALNAMVQRGSFAAVKYLIENFRQARKDVNLEVVTRLASWHKPVGDEAPYVAILRYLFEERAVKCDITKLMEGAIELGNVAVVSYLQNYCPIASRHLYVAVKHHQLATVQLLLNYIGSLNGWDDIANFAVARGEIDIVREFLNRHLVSEGPVSLLVSVVRNKRLDILRMLIEQFDVNTPEQLDNALDLAMETNNQEIADYLVNIIHTTPKIMLLKALRLHNHNAAQYVVRRYGEVIGAAQAISWATEFRAAIERLAGSPDELFTDALLIAAQRGDTEKVRNLVENQQVMRGIDEACMLAQKFNQEHIVCYLADHMTSEMLNRVFQTMLLQGEVAYAFAEYAHARLNFDAALRVLVQSRNSDLIFRTVQMWLRKHYVGPEKLLVLLPEAIQKGQKAFCHDLLTEIPRGLVNFQELLGICIDAEQQALLPDLIHSAGRINLNELVVKAARCGNLVSLRYLVEEQHANRNLDDALCWAIRTGHRDVVKYLLYQQAALLSLDVDAYWAQAIGYPDYALQIRDAVAVPNEVH